jgi:phosphoserine phosphatase
MKTNEFADTFFVLDFDRCIGDTNGIQSVLEEVILRETGIAPEILRKTRTQVESSGRTFDTIRQVHVLLADAGSDVTWEHIRQRFVEQARSRDLLLPHAHELLTILRERHITHGIITYGIEEAWQLTKLEATGLLGVPHLITRIEEKGTLLTGWKQENGLFAIPPALSGDRGPFMATELVFIDDKAKSFWNIPEGVWGVHVIAPEGNVLPSQWGKVPPQVTDVTGIDGVIKLLFDKQ